MTSKSGAEPHWILPNLGAEEGDDERAYREQPSVRAAAHLWMSLFGREARLLFSPTQGIEADPTAAIERDALWPEALGAPPPEAAFPWLDAVPGPTAWYATAWAAEFARTRLGASLSGADPAVTSACHDKAFAVLATEALGLGPRTLTPLVEVLSPEDLRDADRLLPRLERRLADWPAWCEGRFTLKPRFGSSGRGRIGGRDQVDTPEIRGGLPRLAQRGGAIFEPWLDRTTDLSVSLRIPAPDEETALPFLIGSLEMWTSPSGVYRGHCGEVDSRGRVFSGDRDDESLRADAAAVAGRAQALGFFGPCGLDAFRYREPPADPAGGEAAVDRLRPAVEWNARPTMGLVTIGLVRRALPLVREALALTPGDRRGVALTYHARSDSDWRARLTEGLGEDAVLLDLSCAHGVADPRPVLAFTRDPEVIRSARASVFDC